MIAYFSFHCGWSKDDVLSLYDDEIPLLVRNIEKQRMRGVLERQLDLATLASLINTKPASREKYVKDVKRQLRDLSKIIGEPNG